MTVEDWETVGGLCLLAAPLIVLVISFFMTRKPVLRVWWMSMFLVVGSLSLMLVCSGDGDPLQMPSAIGMLVTGWLFASISLALVMAASFSKE